MYKVARLLAILGWGSFFLYILLITWQMQG
jgi:hypothetical protein